MSAGDGERFERFGWEITDRGDTWERLQSSPAVSGDYVGMDKVVRWEREKGSMAALAESVKHLNHAAQNWRRGKPLWGRAGIVVSQIGAKTSIYTGERFDSTCFAIVPTNQSHVSALAAFALSGRLKEELSKINPTWKLGSPKTLLRSAVRHRAVAAYGGGAVSGWVAGAVVG
jgi:hypothetical protein